MNVADAHNIPYRAGECVLGGRELAQAVARAYLSLDPDAVVAIGGSVARGDADRYSDLEIVAVWSRLPPQEDRLAAVQAVGGELWTMDRDGECMEHFGVGRLPVGGRIADGTSMISVGHLLESEVEAKIHRVFRLCGTDLEDHADLAFLRDAVAVGGSRGFEAWQAALADYPEALQAAVIRESIGFGPWFVPQALAARGDRLALHAHMHVVERHLLRVLAALNRRLVAFPTGKWSCRLRDGLMIRPSNLPARLDACYGPDLAAGWEAMRTLMMETVGLVEWGVPALQTESGEALCEWARGRWDPLPPYTLMLEASRFIEAPPEGA